MNNKQVALYITVVISVIIGILICGGIIIEDKNISLKGFNLDFLETDEEVKENQGSEYGKNDVKFEIKKVELNFDNYTEEYSSTEDTNVFTKPMNLSSYEIEEVIEEKNMYPIQNENGLYQYINTKGEYVNNNQYEFAQPFSEGIAVVYEEEVLKFIDENFQEVIENKDEYFYASDFKNGISICSKNRDNEIAINKDGQEILTADNIVQYSNGILQLDNDEKETYYSDNGTYLPILEKYEFYGVEKSKFIPIMDEDYNISCIDREGSRIDIEDGTWYMEFNNKIACVWIDGKSEYININEEFEVIPFKQGYIYIDGDNNENMHCLFDYYAENPNETYVYIDNEGNILFRSEFNSYDGVIDGVTTTLNEEKYSFVDLKTNEISEKKYDSIVKLNNKYFTVECDSKYGIVNSNEEIIIPIEYKEINVVGEFIVCKKFDKDNIADIYNEQSELMGQSYY